MPVRIRLSRIGKKHVPFYRIISVDSHKKRDGAFLEDLGTYDPLKSVVIRFDEVGYQKRLSQGAIPSDAVKKIFAMYKKGEAGQALPKKAKPSKKAAQKPTKEAEKKEEAPAEE